MSLLEGKKDAFIGTVLLFLSLGLLLLIPSQVPPSDLTSTLPPFVFPMALLILMVILSIMLVIRGYKTIKHYKHVDENEPNKDPVAWRDLSLFIITPFFIIITSNIIGFVFASMISMFCMLWILGSKNILRMILLSILLPLGVDLVLRLFLNIFLPLGFWEQIL